MKPVRTVSRFTYLFTFFVLMVAVILSEALFTEVVAKGLGFEGVHFGQLIGGFGVINVILVPVLTDRFFKALGLSRSGRMVEGRRAAIVETNAPEEDVVVIRMSRSLSNWLMFGPLGLLVVLVLFMEVIIPVRDQTGHEARVWLYPMLISFAALGYALRLIPVIRIDQSGVTSGRGRLGLMQTVPWSEIESCVLVAMRDTFGNVSIAYPVIKDGEGKDLFPTLLASFMYVSREDQQRVLQILKKRFPKLDLDPWEL